MDSVTFMHAIPAIMFLVCIQLLQRTGSLERRLKQLGFPLRCCLYSMFLIAVVLFGVDGGAQFIYFQF